MGTAQATHHGTKTRSSSPTHRPNALMTWSTLEPWQRDDHILTGYRPISNSYLQSLASIFSLHNQSVNIWTHLVGATLFATMAGFLLRILAPRYESATAGDLMVFGCFFGGTILCLVFSTAFHTFTNHSDRVYHQWLFLDFLGILCMIAGSWFPGVYYGFYCTPHVHRGYWAMITALTLTCAGVVIIPQCRTDAWKPFRTLMFISLGLSGLAPMIHSAQIFGIEQARRHMGWGWFMLEGIFYMTGALIYANKLPERLKPGAFDIWGNSHQIFHIFVLFGGLSHLTGIVKAFDYHHHPSTRSYC